jgi:Protein of unknown function (DUF5131)
MAATTKIGWAHATLLFWIGCTEVGPGCIANCYARKWAREKMGIGWGDDAVRRGTSEETWKQPARWNAAHDRGQIHMMVGGKPTRVPRWIFGNNLSDFFDNHPQVGPWRADAWQVIHKTPLLRWILLTKRVSNVSKMLPTDWGGGRDYQLRGATAGQGCTRAEGSESHGRDHADYAVVRLCAAARRRRTRATRSVRSSSSSAAAMAGSARSSGPRGTARTMSISNSSAAISTRRLNTWRSYPSPRRRRSGPAPRAGKRLISGTATKNPDNLCGFARGIAWRRGGPTRDDLKKRSASRAGRASAISTEGTRRAQHAGGPEKFCRRAREGMP